jgi:hypothetical protein
MSPWISFVLFISRYCCLSFAIGGSDVHTCCCRDIITYSTYYVMVFYYYVQWFAITRKCWFFYIGEIVAKQIEILNTSKPVPFQIYALDTSEEVRLKYRFLDLRTDVMQH